MSKYIKIKILFLYIMVFFKKLNDFQEKIFDIIIFISYALIVISFLGLFNNAPTYLSEMDYYFRIYICLFLIWRFNPLRSVYIFTNLDRKIAFNAGIFILTTTILKQYIDNVKNKVQENRYVTNIKNIINKLLNNN